MKSILFVYFILFSFSVSAQDTARFIDVNGTSEVIAQADYVFFDISIKSVAESLDKSREINLAASDELLDIIKRFKISGEDWELSPIQFGKEYTYSREERKFAGYFSQVNVKVKLKNLNDYYGFIKELSENKLYEIVRSNFGVTDFLKYHKEATVNAVKAAKEKAGYIAESMGLRTGKIIQIKELNQFETYPNPYNTVSLTGKAQEDISGEISFSRSVNMKVELVD